MFKEVLLMYRRNVLVTLKNPVHLFIGLFQPLCFLFLFAPLLKPLAQASLVTGNHLTMFIPGLLVMLAFYGSAYVGFSLIDDWRTGYLERLWVTPISRTAIVMGRSLRDITIVIAQSLILIAISYIAGLEASFPGILLALLLVVLVAAILSSASYILALQFKAEDALAGMLHTVLLPLQLLAGITLPLALAPSWMQKIAWFNPLAHAVDGARALFLGNFSDTSVIISFCMLCIITVAAVYALIKTYEKKAV
jgi:ABC-2 type transport system permease protein